ncbi:hypothetical protein ABKN59_008717 [Abortiporus biennis]
MRLIMYSTDVDFIQNHFNIPSHATLDRNFLDISGILAADSQEKIVNSVQSLLNILTGMVQFWQVERNFHSRPIAFSPYEYQEMDSSSRHLLAGYESNSSFEYGSSTASRNIAPLRSLVVCGLKLRQRSSILVHEAPKPLEKRPDITGYIF